MNSTSILIFCFAVIIIANGVTIGSASDSNDDSVTEIYEFWKQQDKSFHLDKRKDVVLFLGSTGSGKSSTALLVAGANLNAVAADEDSDDSADSADSEEIYITDENNKIGHESIKSHTLIPDLFTDESGVAYYDCPGFEDTRSPKHELTIAFFLNKLMNYADSFKLVFVVTHSTVRKHENRNNFVKLVHNAVKLIKDIENYSEGIGLVVAKVHSSKEDDKVIKKVASFLKEVQKTLTDDNNAPNLSDDERKLNADSIKFIEALLHKKDESYPKIGIFRRPIKVGPILQAERTNLKTMINENLKYVRKGTNDFGFVISPESKNYIADLTQKIIQDGFVSDMTNIGHELKEFYKKKENQLSDISELYEISKSSVDLFSAINTEDPRLFLKEILNATYVLEIAVSNDTIEPILKHIESIDFLMTVVDQTLTNQLIHQVNDIVKSLQNSRDWYGFLMYLEEELTNIDFLNDDMKIVARSIMDNLKMIDYGENDKLINIGDIGLKLLLEKSTNNKISYIHSQSTVNLVQLKALKNILNEFTNDRLTTTCSSNQLNMEVKGNVIKMSDVLKDDCYATAKNIKIFALNKLIVDENIDKTGQQAQILIIAPTWDINEHRSFILDGENGKNHSLEIAANGTGANEHPGDGENGEPGLPGSGGGNFFAIGSKFLHGELLTIQANGGNGGAGQHGGNGTLSIEGKTPPVPAKTCPTDLEKLWNAEKFDFDELDRAFFPRAITYMVHGKKGTKAGDGGNGGKQGSAGSAGKIMIFELDQTANFNTHTVDGVAGAVGKGGIGGGKETENGKSLKVTANEAPTEGYLYCGADIDETIDNGKNDAGKDGIDNEHTQSMLNAIPPPELNHPSYAVNEYKSFARERSIGNSRQTEIKNFLNKITNKETLKAQYGVLDLIDEFITMENQYFRMRGKIDFIPLLESLLNRTEEFAKTATISIEQKKALAYLYTAILSKINGINTKVYENTVFDLNEYLRSVTKKIEKLHETIDEVNRNEVRNDFNAALNEKMRSANQFIETQITPEIDNIFQKIDNDIKDLIKESIDRQDDVTEGISTKRRRKRELQDKLRLQRILGPIKIIATAAGFFGPFGAAAGAAISGGKMVIDALVMNDGGASANDKVIPLTSADFKSKMAKVTDTLKQKPTLVKKKITDLDKYLTEKLATEDAVTDTTPTIKVSKEEIRQLGKEIKHSKAEIDELNEKLAERIKNGDFNVPKDLMQQCEKIEEKLGDLTKKAKENIEERKNQLAEKEKAAKERMEKQLLYVSYVQNVVTLTDMTVDFYNQICNSEAKIKVMGDAVVGLQKELAALRDHEGKIHNVLIPQVGTIQNNINEMSKNLAGNTHVELDVKKWNIRSTLSEVRLLFSQMTEEFSVHDSLGLSIGKLDEGMSTLIDVYDRIDSYSDSVKLTSYIENIVSHKSRETAIDDTELSDAVAKLKQMIQSNIVLEEYEMATHAFKQHNFPIANFLMTDYLNELPPSLQMDDTNALIQKSIGQVEKIMDKIALSKAVQTKYGSTIHPKAVFDGGAGSQPPFYTWKYHEYKDQIKNLLQGKEITVKADVTRGVNQNAIAFKKIGIYFKLLNADLQNDLDNILLNFRINMTMVGTNYYRCNNRYYQIPLDRNVDIVFKFNKETDGTPIDPNGNYDQIVENLPFLSPYVMWTINMSGDLSKLQNFVDQILDLELIGTGQYLEHGEFSNQICNDRLDKYYNFDNTISNVKTLMLSKGL